ncbi:MAG: MFS transporter [Thermoflexales bacterium]
MTLLAPEKAPRYVSLKLFYFCFYGALGAYWPFLQLYYRDIGLDVAQIGILATLGGLIGVLAGPLWAILADAFRLQRILLPLCLTLNLGMTFVIGQTPTFAGLIAIVGVNAFVAAPIGSLSDSGVIQALGERRDQYGAQRLWGAVAWIASSLVVGALVTRLGVWVIFPAAVALGIPAVIMAARLPRGEIARPDLRKGAGKLIRDRGWLIFILSAFLLGLCLVASMGFTTSYLHDIGGSGEVVGVAFAAGAVLEIPTMALASRIIRRFSARRTLACAALLYAITAAAQSLIVNPWLAAAALGLRGAGYGLFWTAGVLEAQALAPKGMNATAQSLFGAAMMSVPQLAFTTPAGLIYRDQGFAALFRIGALLGLGAAAGMLAGRGRTEDGRPTPARDGLA